jgi:hypothetical protein
MIQWLVTERRAGRSPSPRDCDREFHGEFPNATPADAYMVAGAAIQIMEEINESRRNAPARLH